MPTQAPAPLHPTGGETSHLGPNPVCRAPLGHLRSWGAGVLQGEVGRILLLHRFRWTGEKMLSGCQTPESSEVPCFSWSGAGLVPEIRPSLERVSVSASCCLPGGTLPAQHSPSVVLIPRGMQLTPVPSWMWAIDLLVHTGEELFLLRRGAPCPWGGIASDARGCYHH